MIDSRYSLPGLSRRFQTLDWIPMGAAYGDDLPPLGRNTEYPAGMNAQQIASIYWLPQQFAITSATITTPEYGELSLVNLPVLSGYRTDDTFPNGAQECLDLIYGIGGMVQTEEEFESGGTSSGTVIVSASFTLNAIAVMTPESFWLSFDASVEVRPVSTNPTGIATTRLITGSAIDAGYVNVLQENGENVGVIAPMVYKSPESFSDCESVIASLTIDYVPWIFAD